MPGNTRDVSRKASRRPFEDERRRERAGFAHELARRVTQMFASAGIVLGGSAPWDIEVHDDRFYGRVALERSIGLGESYVDGWWDCRRIDDMSARLFRSGTYDRSAYRLWDRIKGVICWWINRQSRYAARRDVRSHYDLGNDLFENMLGRRMIYSCAYWKDADTLDDAQEAKLALICRKLGLKSGMTVLDIGCGWGGFAQFAAERFGVHVLGITIAPEQVSLARRRCEGWPVEIRLQDYREARGQFDRVVSIGMFEHVGLRNYSLFMRIVRDCLKPDGLFLLHVLGSNVSETHCDPWVNRYVFPGGMLPSIRQLGEAIERRFVMEDWQNIGAHYDRTLLAWHSNFENAWPCLKDRYGANFYRLWKLYLLGAAGFLRSRNGQVWQVVLSPQGVSGGYESCR